MRQQEDQVVIAKTKKWILDTVIGLNLCPFAKSPFVKNLIQFSVSSVTTTDDLLVDIKDQLLILHNSDSSLIETSLLIHPHVLNDFLDYNDFLSEVDSVVKKIGLENEIQVASFHPRYQFNETQIEDIENYTNRSPFPMLHFLRESSVTIAVDGYVDVDLIPDRNIETLKNLRGESLKKLKNLV